MGKKIDVHIIIPVEINEKLEAISEAIGSPKTFLITQALEAYLKLWQKRKYWGVAPRGKRVE